MTPPETRPAPVMDLLSLVIPVYNERDSLPALLGEIDLGTHNLGFRVEVIFIDDGSTDGSWDVIRALGSKDPRVAGIRFRRNFGKSAALHAGFQRAAGGLVITLDADLQDDPREIPRFVAAIKSGLDVASGWKQVRRDPWHKVFPSRVFNRLVSRGTGVKLHDHNCGYKAYRAEVLREVRLYGEFHRFVPVLAAAEGFRVGELVVNHRPRVFGVSKFGWRRFSKGFLDLITVRMLTMFGRRPGHLFGSIGLTLGAGGSVIGLLCLAALVGFDLGRWGTFGFAAGLLAAVAAVLAGVQAFFTGLTAEFVLARTPGDVPHRVAETYPHSPRQ